MFHLRSVILVDDFILINAFYFVSVMLLHFWYAVPLEKVDESISELLMFIILNHIHISLIMKQTQPFKLMFFKKYTSSPLQKLNPPIDINYILQIDHSLFDFSTDLGISPFRLILRIMKSLVKHLF